MKFTSQIGQDQWVCERFNYKRNGYFIEIGAADGIRISNTYYLEKTLEWTGICVEASTELFNQLINNRNCVCINKAIYNKNEIIKFHESDCDGSIRADGELTIEAITIKKLIEENNVPKIIDYISLDVEGAEYDILTKFPFEEYEVILWTIEHNSHLDEGELKAKIRGIMTNNGYAIVPESISGRILKFEDWYINIKYL